MRSCVVGFDVVGLDIHAGKVAQINAGSSYIQDIPSASIAPLVKSGKLRATTDFSEIATLDTINICVPTPLGKTKDPDMRFIESACDAIAGGTIDGSAPAVLDPPADWSAVLRPPPPNDS